MAVDSMSGTRDVTLHKSPTLLLRRVDVKGISLPLDLVRLTTNCQVTVKPLGRQDDSNLWTGSVRRTRSKQTAEVSSAAPAQSRMSRRSRKCPKRLISGPVVSPPVKMPSGDAPTVRNPLPGGPRAKQGNRKRVHVAINGRKSDRLSNKPPLLVSPTVLVREDSSGPAAVSTMKGKRSEKSAKPKPRGWKTLNSGRPGAGRNRSVKKKKRSRIVSAAFVDSSEDTSDGEAVKERERQQRKRKRARASLGQKSPPAKRRKRRNSEAEPNTKLKKKRGRPRKVDVDISSSANMSRSPLQQLVATATKCGTTKRSPVPCVTGQPHASPGRDRSVEEMKASQKRGGVSGNVGGASVTEEHSSPPLHRVSAAGAGGGESSSTQPLKADRGTEHFVMPETSADSTPIPSETGHKARGEESGGAMWTCSSDDDFAVSMRLEELQQKEKRNSTTAVTECVVEEEDECVVEEEGVSMLCSSPKSVGYPPYVVVNFVEVEKSQEEAGCDASYSLFSNLEIDPSALVANCESVANAPARHVEECEASAPLQKKSVRKTSDSKAKGVVTKPQSRVKLSAASYKTGVRNKSKQPAKGRGRATEGKGTKDQSGRSRSGGRRPAREKTAEQPKRPRGRPRKEEGRDKPKRPRGRPRKDEGKEKPRRARSKPSKVENSASPQAQLGSPQNGEDSGYPGSISSTSSHGLKGPKSPQIVAPILVDNITTISGGGGGMLHSATPHDSDVIITQSGTQPSPEMPSAFLGQHVYSLVSRSQQQLQQTVAVGAANLSLFSSEPMETSTIPNFPIPDSQWVWSSGVGMANADELFTCSLEQGSEVNQSLFEPSKMVIAKVESLSEDSQFNEYLNEILESEEVVQCLNSLTTAPLLLEAPPQLQTTAISPSETTATTQTVTATTNLLTDAGTGAGRSGKTEAFVAVFTSSATAPTTATQATSGLVQPAAAETVAAYVAAETNIVPFTMTDCLKTGHNACLETCQTGSNALLGVIEAEEHPRKTGTASSYPELNSGSDVMWSPTGAEETTLPAPLPQQQHQQKEVPAPPPVASEVSQLAPGPTRPAPSATVEPHQQKRRIICVKRRLKDKKAADLGNSTGGSVGKPECSQKSSKNVAQSPPSSSTSETVERAPVSEVKSRNGRLIKPSWKLVQAKSSRSLRCASPPGTLKLDEKRGTEFVGSDKAMHVDPTEGKSKKTNFKKSRTTCTINSLSLAAAICPISKKLPDISATPCSPSSVSFPSTPAAFSMSLDDILREMKDDECETASLETARSSALEFAQSLLADVASVGVTRGEEEKQRGEKEDVVKPRDEKEGDRKGNSEKKRCLKSVKRASDTKSLVNVGKTDCGAAASNSDASDISQTAPGSLAPEVKQVSGSPDSLFTATLTLQPLLDFSPSDPGKTGSGELQLECRGSTTVEEDCCRSVDMDLCDSDTSVSSPRGSPGFKRLCFKTQNRKSEQPTDEANIIGVCDQKKSSVQLAVGQRDGGGKEEEEEEEEEEDRIELFAEDIDMFTQYTMDEGKRVTTPPRMPTPPRETSPLQFKKQHVVEWVEQQRNRQPYPYPPDTYLPHPDVARLHTRKSRFHPSTPPPTPSFLPPPFPPLPTEPATPSPSPPSPALILPKPTRGGPSSFRARQYQQ